MKKILTALYTVSFLTGMVLSQPSWAQDMFLKAHDHVESTYSTGPLLTLPDAIKRALDASPRIKSAAAAVESAKGAEEQSASWPNPEIEFEAENLAGSGEFQGRRSAEYSYGLTQTVEVGGKRSARKDVARAAYKGAVEELTVERLDLERDVYIAYSNVLAGTEVVRLAKAQELLAQELLATVSEQMQAAEDAEIHQVKAEIAYSLSSISRQRAEADLEIELETLAKVLGASSLENSLDHSLFFNIKAPDTIENYRRNLASVPDMQKLSYVKMEKESLLDLERAQVVPDIDFGIGVKQIKESDDHAFFFSVSIPLPVFDRNGGNIAMARGEVRQAENNIRQAELMLEQELTENWQQLNVSYLEAESLRTKTLPSAERALELAYKSYTEGKLGYLEVLDAQRTLLDTRAQYHESLKLYHSAHANVKRLTAVAE